MQSFLKVRPAPLEEELSSESEEGDNEEYDNDEDSMTSTTSKTRKKILERKIKLLMKRFNKKINSNLANEKEVILPILRYLSRNELLNCMVVSKDWNGNVLIILNFH